MAKRKMSRAARKRIGLAVKRRWAAYRKAKKAGVAVTQPGPKRRAGRRRSAAPMNDLAAHSIDVLITMRRRIDQELADRLVRGL